ncbi:DUF533 domain-containing protein [Jannaschia sp. LMIT008]|uniref:DUF533 domain-containing protein n=1 Tax=Jannaschia maritima TaxID=3032585 RepID=UPI00281286EF|nr:DUF533 domain-containing protein [Jannaschia sp. LMIT008]
MSLKRMAIGMAIAFAASKGVDAMRRNGGLQGLQRQLGGAGGASGGLGGLLRNLGGSSGGMGSRTGAAGGGLGGLLGALGGSTGGGGLGGVGRAGAAGGGLGGLLGGLASMAGGHGAVQQGRVRDEGHAMEMAESGPQDEATAACMIRAMAQAVRADGHIDADEEKALMEVVDQAADPGDRAAVEAALAEPIDPEGLAADVPVGHESEVYAAALTAIDPDSATEKQFLARFAKALRLPDQTVQDMHDAQGKPR